MAIVEQDLTQWKDVEIVFREDKIKDILLFNVFMLDTDDAWVFRSPEGKEIHIYKRELAYLIARPHGTTLPCSSNSSEYIIDFTDESKGESL